MRIVTTSALAAVLAAPAAGRGGEDPADRVARLVRQLGHDRYAAREAAGRDLETIGEPALEALWKAASDRDPEVSRRAGLVIQAIARHVTRRELEKLDGTWGLVSYETDGVRVGGEDKTHVFTFRDGRWSLRVGGQVAQAGTVERIEVAGKVHAIDLLITEGGNAGVTAVSIYAIDGNSLKYLNCGAPRATEFVTRPGDGRVFLTFRRAKPEAVRP
jgi:uncharacterized protein (TIGR03067 family)